MPEIRDLIDLGLLRREMPRFRCCVCGHPPKMVETKKDPVTFRWRWFAECCGKQGLGEITRDSPEVIDAIVRSDVV